MSGKSVEEVTKVVYGETFGRYNKDEFLEFLKPLEVRLEQNNIPRSVFSNMRCLDAGCGGGRGTVLMGQAGAKEVYAFDLSEQNVKTTQARAEMFGLSNVHTQCGSLLELPFEDESFDIVWCNGVLHHTSDPDKALSEVARVLKKGGHMWLYLYGSGGIYWHMVDFIRDWLKDVEVPEAIAQLALCGFATGHIAEFIDDWFVPNLKRYTNEDVTRRLNELGFGNIKQLSGGMIYDTSVRSLTKGERLWMGEGDLRYWVKKEKLSSGSREFALPDKGKNGSYYDEPPEVQAFSVEYSNLVNVVSVVENSYPSTRGFGRTVVAARMHKHLRDSFSSARIFQSEEFRTWILDQIVNIRRFSL